MKQVRSLDGSLTLGPAFLWEGRTDYPLQTVRDMADCSMNVQSLDQVCAMAACRGGGGGGWCAVFVPLTALRSC